MPFKRVLLLQAKYDSVFSNVLPAGAGYLSEFLTLKGVENVVFDLNVSKNTEGSLHEIINDSQPDLVGMSMMSLNYKYNYALLSRIKYKFPKIRIVAGGAHISTMREDALEECPSIDYGVTLEGEHTLLELMEGKSVSGIKGLIYRDHERIVYTGDRPFIKDLDTLPFPRYTKFCKNDYSGLISIFTSRGCPFECTYCPVKLAIGRRFDVFSAKRVADEIEFHYKQGYRQFSIRDDNFTLIRDRVFEICDEIERRELKGLYLMCDNGVRADKIDHQILSRMKEIGFKMIGIGVEAGSDKVLKSLKKSATIQAMENAIKTACDLGYIVELFFLIGAPGETEDDFSKSVELAIKYPVMTASFYHILPYPNTEMFEFASRNNYLLRKPEEYLNDGSQRRNTPFMETPEFSEANRTKAFDYAYARTAGHVRKARIAYSRMNVYEKFRGMGVGRILSNLFSNIYVTEPVYSIVNSKTVTNLRNRLNEKAARSV